jgi:hypothetical protein
MAPTCSAQRQEKYSYSEGTLTGQIACTHCGTKFKAQGIKKHEMSCKKRLETEEEQQRFNREYEKGRRKGAPSINCVQSIDHLTGIRLDFQNKRLAGPLSLESTKLAHQTQPISLLNPSLTVALTTMTHCLSPKSNLITMAMQELQAQVSALI